MTLSTTRNVKITRLITVLDITGIYICSFFFSDVDWISSDTSIDMMSWNVNIPLIIKYIPPMIVVPLLIISDAIPITAKNTSMITFNFSL